jgi:hypothetical protein
VQHLAITAVAKRLPSMAAVLAPCCAALRLAMAMIVSIGLTPRDCGKTG